MVDFTDIFGGGLVDPSELSYTSQDSPSTLVWPPFALEGDDSVARIMDITATADSTIVMPDPSAVSVGMTVLFRNVSAYTITIESSSGSVITTIATGQAKFIYLTDNSSSGGTWGVLTFGAGTSSPGASALQGLGVYAIGTTLNAGYPVTSVTTSFTIQTTDRAKLYNYSSGTATVTLQTASTYGANFFFMLANNGSGAITVAPSGGQTIDTAVSLTVNPGESTVIVTDGSNWFTI